MQLQLKLADSVQHRKRERAATKAAGKQLGKTHLKCAKTKSKLAGKSYELLRKFLLAFDLIAVVVFFGLLHNSGNGNKRSHFLFGNVAQPLLSSSWIDSRGFQGSSVASSRFRSRGPTQNSLTFNTASTRAQTRFAKEIFGQKSVANKNFCCCCCCCVIVVAIGHHCAARRVAPYLPASTGLLLLLLLLLIWRLFVAGVATT